MSRLFQSVRGIPSALIAMLSGKGSSTPDFDAIFGTSRPEQPETATRTITFTEATSPFEETTFSGGLKSLIPFSAQVSAFANDAVEEVTDDLTRKFEAEITAVRQSFTDGSFLEILEGRSPEEVQEHIRFCGSPSCRVNEAYNTLRSLARVVHRNQRLLANRHNPFYVAPPPAPSASVAEDLTAQQADPPVAGKVPVPEDAHVEALA